MSERQPMFNVPASVLGVSAVLAVVHLVRVMLPREQGLYMLYTLAFVPARYAPAHPVLPGGDIAAVTSFITHMAVHGSWTHLAVNLMWMLAFGSAVAKRIGDARFLVFSAICGVAGALTHLTFHFGELTPVVGASGAISGQMAGAIRFLFSDNRGGMMGSFQTDPRGRPLMSIVETLKDPRILVFIAVWFGINLLFGLGAASFGTETGGGIAWEAHVGGFVAGMLLIGLFDRPRAQPVERPGRPA